MEFVVRFSAHTQKILREYHTDAEDSAVCSGCVSSCCRNGGPGILENVILTYDLYRRGMLNREEGLFPEGYSFARFVGKYFEVQYLPHSMSARFLLFYTRAVSSAGRLICDRFKRSVDFSAGEGAESEGSVSVGCVFLERRLEVPGEPVPDGCPGCLLHSSRYDQDITAKPVDCVFFTCRSAGKQKVAPATLSTAWRESLTADYPDSPSRFSVLMNAHDDLAYEAELASLCSGA